MTQLDLNKFPEIENAIGILAFNHLQAFPLLTNKGDITQRIYGCSNFLHYKPDEKYPFFTESAYLRAALSEFVSISEMIKRSPGNQLKVATIENSDLPLVHFFKLLREVNFHLKSLGQSLITSNVRSFNTVTKEIHEDIFTLSHVIIDDLDISIFNNSHNIKHYDPSQMKVVINWVKNNQYRWGIFHVLDLALRQYCGVIEKQCSYRLI